MESICITSNKMYILSTISDKSKKYSLLSYTIYNKNMTLSDMLIYDPNHIIPFSIVASTLSLKKNVNYKTNK